MTTVDPGFSIPHDDEYDGGDDALELEALALRRRRRLPLLTALLTLGLVAAAAFIGGVELQKHTGGSSSANAGSSGASAFAARFRGGARGAAGTRADGGFGGGGTFAGGGATVGTVSVIKGTTLYVTDSSGNTVKVTTSAASAVTKTVSSNLQGIRPGDAVVVRGTTQKNGTLAASAISVGGAAGGFGGGGAATGFGSGNGGNGGATGFGGGGNGG